MLPAVRRWHICRHFPILRPMTHPTKTRILLLTAGGAAVLIGSLLLFTPSTLHTPNGVELGTNASLLSEIRAPGGALFATGVLIALGAFIESLTFTSVLITAVVFFSYGLGRVVSFVADGIPASALLAATAVELGVGLLAMMTLVNSRSKMPHVVRL